MYGGVHVVALQAHMQVWTGSALASCSIIVVIALQVVPNVWDLLCTTAGLWDHINQPELTINDPPIGKWTDEHI